VPVPAVEAAFGILANVAGTSVKHGFSHLFDFVVRRKGDKPAQHALFGCSTDVFAQLQLLCNVDLRQAPRYPGWYVLHK
jgi:hypothetical protein